MTSDMLDIWSKITGDNSYVIRADIYKKTDRPDMLDLDQRLAEVDLTAEYNEREKRSNPQDLALVQAIQSLIEENSEQLKALFLEKVKELEEEEVIA